MGWDWSARCGSVNIDLLSCMLALDLTPAHSPKTLALKSVVHSVLAIDPSFDFTSQSPFLWCSGALQSTGVWKGFFFSFKTCRTSHTVKGHLEDKYLFLKVERHFFPGGGSFRILTSVSGGQACCLKYPFLLFLYLFLWDLAHPYLTIYFFRLHKIAISLTFFRRSFF